MSDANRKIALVWPVITSGDKTAFYNVQAFGLAHELVQLGYHVAVFVSGDGNGDQRSFRSVVSEQGKYFRIFFLPVVIRSPRHPIMYGLYHALDRFDPDLIQCAEILTPATISGFLYSRFRRKKFIIYQGVYKHSNRFPALHRLLDRTILRPLFKRTDLFLTKSTAAKQFLADCGAPTERIRTVHLGYTLGQLRPMQTDFLYRKCCLAPNRVLMLTVGRLVPVKNHQVMIDAVGRLKARFPHLVLVVLGNGPKLQDLKRHVEKSCLGNHVRFLADKIPQSRMSQVYGSARIYLSPSLYEIFGMTVLEAMACARPVIGSPIGGMKDLIRDGENGFTIAPKDTDALCNRISILLDKPEIYDRLSENALRTAQHFTWPNAARRFAKAYAEIGISSSTDF